MSIVHNCQTVSWFLKSSPMFLRNFLEEECVSSMHGQVRWHSGPGHKVNILPSSEIKVDQYSAILIMIVDNSCLNPCIVCVPRIISIALVNLGGRGGIGIWFFVENVPFLKMFNNQKLFIKLLLSVSLSLYLCFCLVSDTLFSLLVSLELSPSLSISLSRFI